MDKSKHLIVGALFIAATALSSCSDHEIDGGGKQETSASSYGVVNFTFSNNSSSYGESRTIYSSSDKLTNDDGSQYYQINWVDGDAITVYSDDCYVGEPGSYIYKADGSSTEVLTTSEISSGSGTYYISTSGSSSDYLHEAGYTVGVADDYDYHGVPTEVDDTKQLLWGKDFSDHTFYGFYPTGRYQSISDGIITMEYHTNQKCYVIGKDNSTGQYETYPDMNNAYMFAKNHAYSNMEEDEDHVLLHFDPIMTTFDITVTAGRYEVATGILDPVTITGVSVIMPGQLSQSSGTPILQYDMAYDGDTDPTPASGTYSGHGATGNTWGLYSSSYSRSSTGSSGYVTGNESVFVNFYTVTDVESLDTSDYSSQESGEEEDGTTLVTSTDYLYYVKLNPDESIRFLAFCPPMSIENSYCYIKVHTTTGYNFVKKVSFDPDRIPARCRVDFQLPDIYPSSGPTTTGDGVEEATAYDRWLTYLDGNIAIDRLSIPAYKCTTSTAESTVKKLLSQGVRGFEVPVTQVYNIASSLAYTHVIDDSGQCDFSSVFESFIEDNPGEFLLVWGNVGANDYAFYYDYDANKNKKSSSAWVDVADIGSKDLNISNISVEDARGKIVCMQYYTINDGSRYMYQAKHIPVPIYLLIPDYYTYILSKSTGYVRVYNSASTISIDGASKYWVRYLASYKTNEAVYCTILEELSQKGGTQVIVIPNAESGYTYDSSTDTATDYYGDLLIQAIIACNYKFNHVISL